jgi:hypothetical protein
MFQGAENTQGDLLHGAWSFRQYAGNFSYLEALRMILNRFALSLQIQEESKETLATLVDAEEAHDRDGDLSDDRALPGKEGAFPSGRGYVPANLARRLAPSWLGDMAAHLAHLVCVLWEV